MSTEDTPDSKELEAAQPPDLEDWRQRVRLANEEELRALQDTASLGLHGDGESPRSWAFYKTVVEEEMHRRGIKP